MVHELLPQCAPAYHSNRDMNLTQAQQAILRTRPHRANLFLSIYHPKTLLQAQVTGSYNVGDQQITYYGVTTGTYLNLYPDLTVMIGSTPGTDDVGRVRMRSASGTYVNFAENAINWQTNMYLTFIDQIDIEAIYPRIIQDPNNQTNVIFYKDYDIPYSNQNAIYGTFINAGPHRAGFLPSGTAYFTATGTYNVNGNSLTYDWAFEGGTPTGSTALSPGDIRWTTPGHYRVRLRVTSSSGAVDETHRYVSWYTHPDSGNSPPIARWELRSLSGSRSEGGYTATIKVWDDLGDIQPNAVVVIFSDNWYGSSQVNLGGNAIRNPSIFFVGYIIGDSIKVNWQESSVEFSVGGISEIMKNAEGFSVSCESKAAASTWFELTEMTTAKAMYHYLRWHSTVLKTVDFQYTGDDRLVQYFDADRGSLYDAIDSFVRQGLLGELVSDRQGKLWAELSPFGYENPMTSIPTYLFPLQKQDWMGDIGVTERRNSEMSFVEMGGIAYYGVTSNGFSALLANAPSTVPLYYGKSNSPIEGLILNTQGQLNQLAGNYLAYHNSRYPEVNMSMNGIYTNLDIAPLERLFLVLSPSDLLHTKPIQGLPYTVSSMEWKYSSVQESLLCDLTLQQLATGTAGVTVQIPATPPDFGYSYPGLSLPPLPNFSGGSNPVGSTIPLRVVMHDTAQGIIYTDNFDSTNPQWITANSGLTLSQYTSINCMFVTPNGAFYVARIVSSTSLFIARAPYVGGPFTIVEDNTSFLVKFPTATQRGFNGISFNPNVPETVAYVLTPTNSGGGYIYIAGAQGVNIPILSSKVVDNDGHRYELKYSLDEWVLFALSSGNQQTIYRINKAGSSIIDTQALGNSTYSAIPRPAGQTGKFFLTGGTGIGAAIKRFDGNNAAIIIDVSSDPNIGDAQGWAVETSEVASMIRHYGAGNRGRSSDGGATWALLGNLPLGTWVWAYAGTGGSTFSTRWIAASGSAIRFSPDFGNTWLNKEGNITSIVAIPDIDLIIVPGVSQ